MKKTKPKVAFPHVGTMYIVWESLIRGLGGEVVVPPYSSKKTLSLGTKFIFLEKSSSFVCILKLLKSFNIIVVFFESGLYLTLYMEYWGKVK